MPSICFRRVVNSFGLCCSAHMGRVLTGPSDVVRLCGRAAGGSSWALARLAPLFRLPTRRVGSAPAEPHRLRQPQGTGGRGCVAGRQQPRLPRLAASIRPLTASVADAPRALQALERSAAAPLVSVPWLSSRFFPPPPRLWPSVV
jgi:hypothetical protein